MADFLIEVTLSNLVVSTILALIAWGVQRSVHSPALANLLWALVLVKMVTPPLLAIPLLQVPSVSGLTILESPLRDLPHSQIHSNKVLSKGDSTESIGQPIGTMDTNNHAFSVKDPVQSVRLALGLWMMVSVILLLVSSVRMIRFHRLLKANSHVDDELTSGLSIEVAGQLGVRNAPKIIVTTANIAPFVWWMAGCSVIVVSSDAIQKLAATDLRLVITHEMAHIRRRDHWFRWLEWITLICLWWNPVMWWTRRQLRISEEMSCDQLVLEAAPLAVNQYANALLNMAELLVRPAIRPPVMASAINSGGGLEKRLKMIMTEKPQTVPVTLRRAIVAFAVCTFPLGFIHAQDFEAVEQRLGGAVEAGELSLAQAQVMMDALRRSAGNREMEAKKHRYMQVMQKIKGAVEEGKLTEEAAEEKLIAIRMQMFDQDERYRDHDREMKEKKRHYMQVMREIKNAVEQGRLSEEEAEEKLIAVRKKMFDQKEHEADHDPEMEMKKRRYMQFTEKIKATVGEGKLSKEEAEKQLIAVRKKMSDQKEHEGDHDREMDLKMRRYMRFAEEIKAALEEGKLSEEEADKKLVAMRQKIFHQEGGRVHKDREIEAKKSRFMEFAKEIEAAVEAGELTREDAEKKLIEMRREMFAEGEE